jgi:hypothetical protein
MKTHFKVFTVESGSEESDHEFSNIIEEEEFEDEPQGYEGLVKGESIEQDQSTVDPKPYSWTETFFHIL